MFLKSIEIRGFKSFADKTELVFKKGVTAVVGPNGSGKSNISDAVRWVLGEQSVRNLRGDKMEDVIFAGTQFRKPVGLAQVSLILDNSDSELDIEYSDVVISRRLYRSGESEYLINNTVCRLKDVQALFMDTGIGKEGYSIIGQGKIDAILSGKPEERRKLLEEAAGIVKYKTRKEEAERKLDNTEQNLVRINDILDTYEERLEPLRIESDKAKRFLELSNELKNDEINIIIDFIEKTEIKISSYKAQCEAINRELQKKLDERREIKEEIELKGNSLEEFENKISEDKQKFYDNKSKHQQVLSEIKILEERIELVNKSIEKNVEEVEKLNLKINSLENEVEKLEISLNDSKNNQKIIEDKIKLKEGEIKALTDNTFSENEKLMNSQKIKQNLLDNKNAENNNIMLLESQVEGLKDKLESLKGDIESFYNSLRINNSTKVVLEMESNKLLEKINSYEEKIKANKNQIGKLRYSQTLEEKKLKELLANSNKIDANLNMLINLDKQYEGYNRAVKLLMKHIESKKVLEFQGNCYVLGEVIEVDKQYEIAMEIALGSSLSNIITEDENDAKILIEYLKKNTLGRASFLPLSTVKGRKIEVNNSIKNTSGYIGVASELIGFDSKFKGIMDYILGKTIICDNMDNALKIAKLLSYKQKIVTLSGEVVNPGGALTGGSIYSKNVNVIGRKREIEELKVKLKDINSEAENKNKLVKKLNENIKILDEENLNLRDEIHFENIEKTKVQSKINSISEEEIKLKLELNKAKENLKNVEDEIASNSEKLNSSKENISAIEEKIKSISDEEESLKNKLKESNINIENYREILTDLRVEKAKIDEITINKDNELLRIKGEIKDYTLKIENLEKEANTLKENKDKYSEILKNNKITIKDTLDMLSNMEKLISDNEIERIKLKEVITKVKEKEENLNLELEASEKELHKYQVNLARIETEKESLLNKLNEEYELTYAEALNFKEPVENVAELKENVAQIKQEIGSLGSVNVGAIEEYKEVKEKYSFMTSQKEDLVQAKDELLKVIEEMTDKMRVVFKENFSMLRKNFNETFKELFKGGSADLILTDGDELTSKIDINVEPPGKKLQNINLLSGGEKVLSAIALLFGILKMKPTPFCILDEIEAALDDANVVRYAEFLKKFSNNIQFIVITHRKGTMEASDVLYGVTMEEKGVSKVVSVDFTEFQKDN